MEAEAMTSSSPSLETLPVEVLQRICDYVAFADSRRASLFCFSLTSKLCCLASTSQRLHRLKLVLCSKDKLQKDVEHWKSILDNGERAVHVRQLNIVGCIPVGLDDRYESSAEKVANGVDKYLEDEIRGPDYDEVEGWDVPGDSLFNHRAATKLFTESRQTLSEEMKQRQDESWQPISDLLRNLPGLKDVVYSSVDQMPRCILAALHKHHPSCHLHMHAFNLNSPYNRPADGKLDPDEVAVATSPLLYSLAVNSTDNFMHLPNYTGEAAMLMAAGAAPKLRHVFTHSRRHGTDSSYQREFNAKGPRFPGLLGNPSRTLGGPIRNGKLRSLILSGTESLQCNIPAWAEYTDFSSLATLEILYSVPWAMMNILIDMAKAGKFQSLRTMAIIFSTTYFADPELVSDVDDQNSLLLRSVPPLEALKMGGWFGNETFNTLVNVHGGTLRRLQLATETGMVTKEHLRLLQLNCPQLNSLELAVRRTHGDKEEVDFYRALGGFPRLRQLRLRLEIAPADRGGAEHMERYSRAEKCEKLRDLLSNCGIDAALVRSIFRIVSSAQSEVQQNKSQQPALDYLKVEPTNFDDAPELDPDDDGDTMCLALWLARGWICERGSWAGDGEDLAIREIRTWERGSVKEAIAGMEENEDITLEIWTELWPASKNVLDSVDDLGAWSSFPLEVD